jgi:ribonuclease HI
LFTVSPTELEVYIAVEAVGYGVFDAFEVGRSSAKFDIEEMIRAEEELPLAVIPIDVYRYPTYELFKFTLPPATIWTSPIQNVDKWQHTILKNLHIFNISNIRQSLEDADSAIYIASDGGVHNYQSNYGVVIAQGAQQLARAMGKIYSITFHESSYIAELYGLLAGTVIIQHIIQKYSIKLPISKKLDFYCDNKSAITIITERLKLRRTVNQHRGPELDIEQQLVFELKQLMNKKCIINICHVKGHQDDKKGK